MDKMSSYSGGSSPRSKPEADTYEKGDNSSYDDNYGAEAIEEPPETPALGNPFRGMEKEELIRHSSKPFWWRLRMMCISVVLLGWLALLITVVALVLIYPRCRDPDMRSWWQNETMYRVYVRSFSDSNGDGIGDLKGLESHLDHIRDLGANTISLSPVYQSDDIDSDFNVIDHMAIDRNYGNMSDFESLLKAAHDRGMHLLMDFIPNHTSDLHQWFINSSKTSDRDNDFRNFYVWTDTPTNWRSVYNNGSWKTSDVRNQAYLHQFLPSQPDLNLRSSQVQEKLEEILKFWLTKGVDGFYIRNSGFMFEDYDLRNEKKSSTNNSSDPTEYSYYDHTMTYGLSEVYDMLSRWRTLVEEFSNTTERILMADARGNMDMIMTYYGHYDRDGVNIALNEVFLPEHGICGAPCVRKYITDWLSNLPKHHWANWVIGADDSARLGSRFNESYIRAFLMTAMLVPGTPIIYYGDEILMTDINVTSESWTREQSMRGLMQWENKTDGGFCSARSCSSSPWLPADGKFRTNNVKDKSKFAGSIISYFKNLTSLRQERTFLIGEFTTAITDDSIFSFVREFDGLTGYLIAINFSHEEQTRDFYTSHDSIEKAATVEFTTGNDVSYNMEDNVDTRSITLGGFQGVVVSWDYVAKEL
ncbi:neutral and basic amino acid transport protein rBAT-like isoform X2 [Mizuhopecten yessoensis]|uniref:Neutral and basic amino acid transport protein rBAT n=2 Tax=Mizuhopecten yessoensis TaxID=6573 RepID=A0A210Q430_MIZYE|nr:neutral and basic amino acid transport protein rBAT-like isoform X2 [Mizuhopecten yessoensis]OWF43494.1 Neutral and basic amino acid transport protein rBAT [Mizuhopecten yessoensis]